MTSFNANVVQCRIMLADRSTMTIKEHCKAEAPLKSAALLRLIGRVEKALNISLQPPTDPANGSPPAVDQSSQAGSTTASAFEFMAAAEKVQQAGERAAKAEALVDKVEAQADAERARALLGPMEARAAAWSELVLAQEHLERLKEQVRAKRQRVAEGETLQMTEPPPPPTEPAWRSRQYADYDLHTWRKLEGEVWDRRRVALSRDVPGRLPEQMPRGERDGPLHHWRRGLVGAVKDWANGSAADAVNILVKLIKELDLMIGFGLPNGVCGRPKCLCLPTMQFVCLVGMCVRPRSILLKWMHSNNLRTGDKN